MGSGALRDVSLKQARECTIQRRFVFREGRDLVRHEHFVHLTSNIENCSLNSSKQFEFY